MLWNGLQAIVHYNEPSLAATTDQAAPSASQSRFEYFHQLDRLHSATPQERTAYDPYGTVRAMSSGSQLATGHANHRANRLQNGYSFTQRTAVSKK